MLQQTSWLSRWLGLICAAVMIAVYGAYYALLAPEPEAVSSPDIRHLVLWGSACLVLNVVMLWCFAVSLLAIRRYAKDVPRAEWKVLLAIAVGVISLMLLLLALKPGWMASAASEAILNPLFEQRPRVKWVVFGTNVVGTPLIVALLVACVLVAREVDSSSADELSARIRWFRILLFSAGTLLAAVIYEVFRLYEWSGSISHGLGEGLASSLTLASGLIFSGFMALIFVPTAMRLDQREHVLVSEAAQVNPHFDREKWALVHRIPASPLMALGSYVAVLLPVITGVLTKVLEGWVGP